VLVTHYVRMGESVPEYVGRVLDSLEGAGIRMRLLLPGREFFSVEAVEVLQRRDTGFLVPCRNTSNVVAALRESGRRKRPAISGNVLEDNSASVRYDMLITRRKKRSKGRGKAGGKAEDRWIGFATNRPGTDTGSYAARWGRDRACQDRGAQGQDEDHRRRCQDAVLLLLTCPVQRVGDHQDDAVRRGRRAERDDYVDLQGVSGVGPDKASASSLTPKLGLHFA